MTAALLGCLALTAPTPVAARTTTPAAGDWTQIAHAHPGGQTSSFADSWSDGADVWAAGTRTINVGGVTELRTWVQRCSSASGACSLENTLDVEAAPSNTAIQGVTGLSETDVWIAGHAKQPFGLIGPLTEHFDGTRWSIVPTPVDAGDLWGISAAGPDDVWAVGIDRRDGGGRPLALHWDGTTWTEDPVDNFPDCTRGMQIWDVDATGRQPLAVATCYPNRGDGYSMILRRGAQGWTAEPTEDLQLEKFELKSITWTGRTAWASGGDRLMHGTTLRLQHGAWARADVPARSGVMAGFVGESGDDVWAVGTKKLHWATMHWDGATWTRSADPGAGWLESVALTRDGTPWAVGSTYGRLSEIQRYDGPL